MPFKVAFRNVDDFIVMLQLTEEKALPIIDWLDTLHGEDQKKVSAAMFFLIARRAMVKDNITKTELINLISVIYDVVTDEDYRGVPWANDD